MAHFKVHELLSGPELEELRTFAREPGRTVDEIHQWLLERGYTMSRSSAGRWKQQFDEELMCERFSRSGELAAAIRDAASRGGAVAISEAAMLQLSQVIFEQSVKLQADGDVDSMDVRRLTASIKSLMDSTQRAEQIKREFETRQKAAVEAAEAATRSGASATAVVDTIKKALGITQ